MVVWVTFYLIQTNSYTIAYPSQEIQLTQYKKPKAISKSLTKQATVVIMAFNLLQIS